MNTIRTNQLTSLLLLYLSTSILKYHIIFILFLFLLYHYSKNTRYYNDKHNYSGNLTFIHSSTKVNKSSTQQSFLTLLYQTQSF